MYDNELTNIIVLAIRLPDRAANLTRSPSFKNSYNNNGEIIDMKVNEIAEWLLARNMSQLSRIQFANFQFVSRKKVLANRCKFR